MLAVVVERTKLAHRRLGLGARVQRFHRRARLALALAGFDHGVPFGERRGVEQHDAAQIPRRAMGVDRPAEPALDEQRQTPRVIEMGVAQYDRVDGLRIKRKRAPVARLFRRTALDQAAVEQQLLAADRYEQA